MLSETIPLDLAPDRKVYRGPGGVLIAGWADGTQAASFNDGKPLWVPTMVLAQRIASQLSSNGAIKAIVSERYYKLPLADETRTATLEMEISDQAMVQPSNRFHRRSPVWRRSCGDAVLEVGLGGYSIWQEQVELEVLVETR